MLAKKFRLSRSENFDKVQKEGRIFQSANFGVAHLNRGDALPSRFAFVVSTKIAREAADRNRYKRAMSEAVRLESINLANGFDVVFLAKTSIVKVSTSEVMKEVRSSLRQIGILK